MTRKSSASSPWKRLFPEPPPTKNSFLASSVSDEASIALDYSAPKVFQAHAEALLEYAKEAAPGLRSFCVDIETIFAQQSDIPPDSLREIIEPLWHKHGAFSKVYFLFAACRCPQIYLYLNFLLHAKDLSPFELAVLTQIKSAYKTAYQAGRHGLDKYMLHYLIANYIMDALNKHCPEAATNHNALYDLASFGSLKAFSRVISWAHKEIPDCDNFKFKELKAKVKSAFRQMNAEENFGLFARFQYFRFLYILTHQHLIKNLKTFYSSIISMQKACDESLGPGSSSWITEVGVFFDKLEIYKKELVEEFSFLLGQFYLRDEQEPSLFEASKWIMKEEAQSWNKFLVQWLFISPEQLQVLTKCLLDSTKRPAVKLDCFREVAETPGDSQAIYKEVMQKRKGLREECRNEQTYVLEAFKQALEESLPSKAACIKGIAASVTLSNFEEERIPNKGYSQLGL